MKTIFLYIREPKLKMRIIRLLLEHSYAFIEAANREEALIKLGLVKDTALLMEDVGENAEDSLARVLHHKQINHSFPVIWILPILKRQLITQAANYNVVDLIPLPLDEKVLLRKITPFILEVKEPDKRDNIQEDAAECMETHLPEIEKVLERAAEEQYPVCMIRIKEVGTELNQSRTIDSLRMVMRWTDSILDMGWGQTTILCPNTPKDRLPILETKIRKVLSQINQPNHQEIHIYGLAWPEDGTQLDELLEKLSLGVRKSMAVSRLQQAGDPASRKGTAAYRNK